MPAYVIGDSRIFDQAEYDKYQGIARPTLDGLGANVLASGGRFEVLDGDWQPSRLVVIEFPSLEQAREWYEGPYQAARTQRLKGASSNVVVVEGL